MTKNNFIAFLFLAGLTASAFAEDDGFYVAASLGSTNSDYANSSTPVALALQAGFQFNKNFSLEGQYADFGNIAPAGSMKPAGFSFSGIGILPFTEQFAAYGKIGMASIGTKISGSGIPGVDGTYTKNAATYGIGGQFYFKAPWSVRFGVDRYTIGGTQGGMILNNGSLTVSSIGIEYKN